MDAADTFTIWQLIRRIRDQDSVSVCWTNAWMVCAGLGLNVLLSWSPTITSAARNSGSTLAGRKFLGLSRWELIFRNSAIGELTISAVITTTRPTAVNLSWAVERQLKNIAEEKTADGKVALALRTARLIADEDVEQCRMIGQHGLKLIEQIAEKKVGKPVNVLTHCNAGWLAFVDYGSATSPIYAAHDSGLPVHVWVAETRPRNQGSKLTAWELSEHGVPHTVIADSAAGHLMQRGEVDLVIIGTDRTTYTGDVANKIGTYLKALAAKDNNVPFYVALPSSSIDWRMRDGMKEIPIEERGAEEIKHADGWLEGRQVNVCVTPEGSPAANYGFDVTPRHLVTGLITERGVCQANEKSIRALFPEHAP